MKKCEQELEDLKGKIVDIGELAESMIVRAIKMISNPEDDATYQAILADEERLDAAQIEIDQEAIRMMTVYGPVAHDLRFLLMVSRINSELERIGDQAVNMCESIQLMASKIDTASAPMADLDKMSKTVASMIHDANTAFLNNDHKLAKQTLAHDDLVDALNDQIVHELLSDELIREHLTGPKDVASALAQILIARSLERAADQATNICEEVVYMVKGADIRHT